MNKEIKEQIQQLKKEKDAVIQKNTKKIGFVVN